MRAILKRILYFIYHEEYKDCEHKRIWILGFKKTFKVNTLPIIRANYSSVEKKLREKVKTQKLRVAFLVQETEKWQYQTLYMSLKKSEHFEPFVIVVPINYKKKDIERLHETYRFFEKQNITVFYGYDLQKEQYIALSAFNTDIVFYQQPWGIHPLQHIVATSYFALTAYCPYAIVENEEVFDKACLFFDALWRHFVTDETAKQALDNKNFDTKNIRITGHPKMDWALDIITKTQQETKDRKIVIYAPHHSFSKSGLRWATFKWSGPVILQAIQEYSEYLWILKPHPLFKKTLLREHIMTEDEYKNYCDTWQKYGKIVTGGNYFELFGKSDLLITDCGSFLAEYALTKKPVIQLIAENAYPQHPYNEKLSKDYYKVYDAASMKKMMTEILINKNDSLQQKRVADFNKHHFGQATQKIMDSLTHDLGVK